MTREDFIRSLIKSKGYTLKAFSQEIGMPYTTLLSILNGSIGGAAMDNVLKICHALGISLDDLARVGQQHSLTPESASLEEHLNKLIHGLSDEKKTALIILLSKF
ncbi:MAG: HTH cro/C1-type domain-containing protein [Mitsuokella multacida]|jgi:transcriptional regulator with XRE-family HTH domain